VWLGFSLDPNTTESMVVGSVVNGSPASIAGLKVGDLIVQVGDLAVSGIEEFAPALSDLRSGTEISLQIVRDAEFQFISIVPMSLVLANLNMPDPVPGKWCDDNCDCARDMPEANCYVNYIYVGEGPNGGVLYIKFCQAIDKTDGSVWNNRQKGPLEYF
jgi:hypothetical protein